MKRKLKVSGIFIFVCLLAILTAAPVKTYAGCGTQAQALEWVYSQEGKSLDYDNSYGAQCVDLICFYYQHLGAPRPYGNACDFISNQLPAGWTRIANTASFVPEPGDIAVWGRAVGNGYGHVAIILSADVHNFVSMDQNWGGKYCRKVTHNYNNFWGVIRPNFDSADSQPPVIEKVWITNKNKYGYTVNCTVSDNVAVDRVQFPTWTETNGQDDIQKNWQTSSEASGTRSGNTYVYRVLTSDHNNEGGTYFTHIYAYDTSGNESVKQTASAFVDNASPFIKNVKVTNLTKKGYTISCTAVDNVGIDRVLFPTWTEKGGKDDIQKNWETSNAARGTKSGDTYTYEVYVSDHNNEGGIYYTEIYAYDESGNVKTYCQDVTVKVRAAYYGDLDKDGEVTATDMAAVNQAIAGKIKLSAEEKKRADVNGDDKVTKKDEQLITDYVLEEIDKFPVEIYFGDVDMDGEISIYDAGLVSRAASGRTTLSAEKKRRADVNGDGRINSKDTQLIQEYIVENIDKFPAVYYGDVNMDRKVDSGDASIIYRVVAGKKKLSAEQKRRADVDGDAKITKKDARLILQYDVGVIEEFPIEA